MRRGLDDFDLPFPCDKPPVPIFNRRSCTQFTESMESSKEKGHKFSSEVIIR